MTMQQERRRRRWHVVAVRLAAIMLLALSVWGLVIEPGQLVQRDYDLQLERWPTTCDGLRIDVITDTHTGSPRNGLPHLDRVVDALIASDAPVVLMAGDYVILSVLLGTYIPADEIAEHLRPLTARKPVYAVLGNHDWWKNGPQVAQAFARVGVRMIDNRAVPMQIEGCRFWLAGIGDLMEGKPDVRGTYAQIAQADAAVIALTHEPALWPQIPSRTALTIAGHTHGGQFNPFGWMSPSAYRKHSHALRGLYTERGRDLFVSPGIGTSIVPVRVGVPPEISRLTLRRAGLGPPS